MGKPMWDDKSVQEGSTVVWPGRRRSTGIDILNLRGGNSQSRLQPDTANRRNRDVSKWRFFDNAYSKPIRLVDYSDALSNKCFGLCHETSGLRQAAISFIKVRYICISHYHAKSSVQPAFTSGSYKLSRSIDVLPQPPSPHHRRYEILFPL
jgi:hypothetical protein